MGRNLKLPRVLPMGNWLSHTPVSGNPGFRDALILLYPNPNCKSTLNFAPKVKPPPMSQVKAFPEMIRVKRLSLKSSLAPIRGLGSDPPISANVPSSL